MIMAGVLCDLILRCPQPLDDWVYLGLCFASVQSTHVIVEKSKGVVEQPSAVLGLIKSCPAAQNQARSSVFTKATQRIVINEATSPFERSFCLF
ncbi:hypothetical protein ABKN59_004863 [Abortiporus biennis]